MRKIILSLICGVLLLGTLTGCGTNNNLDDNSNNNQNNNNNTNNNTNENTNQGSSYDKSELLPNTYKIPRQEIYVDTPDFNDIEKGYTELFKDGEKKLVAFTDLRNETVKNEKEAFDLIYPKFKKNVSSWLRINGETFTSEERIEVNGIETLKVTGTVKLGVLNYYDCYIYGYSFIFEGVPCAIIGVVSDLDQPQEEIDEVTEIVDAMMKTVRNKR